MFTIFSTSLNPNSRSRILARLAVEQLRRQNIEPVFVDLQEIKLPICDGASCYADPNVQKISTFVTESSGFLIAAPIYNYDVGSSTKNLIELTGQAWRDKVVGFLLSAGGSGSYMAGMGLANSLMLDFRTLVLPRFVYTTPDAYKDDTLVDDLVKQRIAELCQRLEVVTLALEKAK